MVSVRVKVTMYTTRATAATASTMNTNPNTEQTMITTALIGERRGVNTNVHMRV